jgi:signal transduction histidine kinase
MMRGHRTLRSRLFSWFVGAIFLAIFTSSLIVGTTRPEGTRGVEAAAHHMATRLARDWDNEESVQMYVEEIRDVTGFEVRVLRDPHKLPWHVHRVAKRGGAMAPAASDRVFVPVVRGTDLVGALEMNRFGVRPAAASWWRLALALLVIGAILSIMASRVADLLARPLEQLAHAADRFGAGDLGFRADMSHASRWVALEVRDVAVRFNRMADRVEATVRGQRELLGAISHELRSPLGRARVALEIARDRIPGATEQAPLLALDQVELELRSIDSILGELLDVTRAGLADLRKETRDFVEWLGTRTADEPTPPSIEIEASAEAQHVLIAFDPSLLGRAVHNLLINARAHGHPPDRAIRVRVTRAGPVLRVIARDDGPGFAPGVAERAFEPFVRGDPARSRPHAGAGYGLGLAIVRRIVEAHGGNAFARNAEGGGAEVGFDLPVPAQKP